VHIEESREEEGKVSSVHKKTTMKIVTGIGRSCGRSKNQSPPSRGKKDGSHRKKKDKRVLEK